MSSPQRRRSSASRGRIMLRTPTSAAFARASGVTRLRGSPLTGSRGWSRRARRWSGSRTGVGVDLGLREGPKIIESLGEKMPGSRGRRSPGSEIPVTSNPWEVASDSQDRPEPARPGRVVLEEESHRCTGTLSSRVAERRRRASRVVQPDRVDVVETALEADLVLRVGAEHRREPAVRCLDAVDVPVVGLLELVARLGIVQEVGEVREEVQLGVDRRTPRPA